MRGRWSRWVIAMMLACCLVFGTTPLPVSAAKTVYTNAEAAALIDVTSGRILYSHNGDKSMRIASLTKIMTAIVAIEAGNLSDKVKVSVSAYGVEGSSVYLKLGEEISLQHLLYGLMLRSGNDAAVAIAEHVGGSLEGFVKLMNDKAAEIGMMRTMFRNPHGLDAPGHMSTANDMAILTAYALQNPVFRDIVKTSSIKVPSPGEKWDRLWRNKNKMLNIYDGADGVKTGYTKSAKRCLVSSATRGVQQLAAVTLNDGDDWLDHTRLLDYGFYNYPLHVLYEAGEELPDSELVSAYSLLYPLTDDEQAKVSSRMTPVPEGSIAGKLGIKATLQYFLNGSEIGQLQLYDKMDPALQRAKSLQSAGAYKASESEPLLHKSAIAIMGRLFRALFTVL